jgi:valyl-tRNA synthetase
MRTRNMFFDYQSLTALMLLCRFVNVKEMARRALRAVQEGDLKIDPPEFETTWHSWLHDVR